MTPERLAPQEDPKVKKLFLYVMHRDAAMRAKEHYLSRGRRARVQPKDRVAG